MALGFLYGVLACMIWGFVYLVPEVLPGYPPELMAAGRFVSFGLVAVPLAWMERREFAHYTVKDWIDVSKLGVIGNIAYYWCLIECIQNAGVPVAGMAMSAVPVLVAAVSNIRDKKKGTALEVLVRRHDGCCRFADMDVVSDSKRRLAAGPSRPFSARLVHSSGTDDVSLCRRDVFLLLGARTRCNALAWL